MKLDLLHESDEQIRKLERIAKSGDPDAEAMYLQMRSRSHPRQWYRKCTVCENWRSHPLIVTPIRGPDDVGPIGALQIHGYFVETCWAEAEAHGGYNEEVHKMCKDILLNPEETMLSPS